VALARRFLAYNVKLFQPSTRGGGASLLPGSRVYAREIVFGAWEIAF